MKIFHNPRCRKSRETLAFIREKGIDPKIILYLKDSPTKNELLDILKKLNMEPLELIRTKEKIFKENFKGKQLSFDEWIDVMVEYPKLIERPIVVEGEKAVIGRPAEKILELLA